MQYANHEAVAEDDPAAEADGSGHPFVRVTLFKINPELLPDTVEARGVLDWWAARGGFFQYYANGKSAVRCTPSARPLSVHEWLPGSLSGLEHCHSSLPSQPLRTRGATKLTRTDAAILHFAACSSNALWQRRQAGGSRYLLRGRAVPPRIFEDARAAGETGEDDREAVRRLFESRMVLPDAREIARHLAAGVCIRVSAVASNLDADSDRRRGRQQMSQSPSWILVSAGVAAMFAAGLVVVVVRAGRARGGG
eukprot:1636031-Prymnesium_polylepis.1